jgi:hypothetical protein
VLKDSSHRPLDRGRFDLSEWLVELGIQPQAGAIAIFDARARTLVFVNNHENIEMIFTCFQPIAPASYHKA